MTSKNLFFKLIKQDFQKRIWCPILIFLGYFLALEVNMLRMIGRLEEDISRYYVKDISEYVEKCFFGTDVKLFAMLACVAAFLCAISGFSYLHSRVQLDTYHSLPVNRVQIFLSRYVSGVLQFFLPFVIHIILCMGIAAGKAAFSGAAFANAMRTIGVVMLVFLLSYAVFIVASCLTGNLIINILGSAVLFFYSALASLLASEMFRMFFNTYTVIDAYITGMNFRSFWRFSPISMLVALFERDYDAYSEYDVFFKYNADRLWGIAVAAIVYTLIAFVLYQKRSSESAGKAIAFRWAEPVIKTLLVIPTALFSGMFFKDIASSESSNMWYLFGVAFGYVIMALLIESIFRMDIKSALCHKRQLVFNAACLAVIVIIFWYDVLGYNTYVPSDSELVSCSVSIEELMAVAPARSVGRGYYVYNGGVADYRMRNVKIQGNPSVMELARKAASENAALTEEISDNHRNITFGYNLKNGKSVYRIYTVDITDEKTQKLLGDIYNDSSYKVGTNVMLNEGWKQEYVKLSCTGTYTMAMLDVTPELQAKLLETYQEEYMQLDFATVLDTYPVGCMTPVTAEEYEDELKYGHRYSSRRSDGSLIYPQFTKTIALLKENGFDVYETPSAEDIDYIKIQYRKETTEFNGIYEYTVYEYSDAGNIYDNGQKQQVLDNVINSCYDWQVKRYTDFEDDDFVVTVYTKSDDSRVERDFRFKKGMTPAFIYELEGYQNADSQESTQ